MFHELGIASSKGIPHDSPVKLYSLCGLGVI